MAISLIVIMIRQLITIILEIDFLIVLTYKTSNILPIKSWKTSETSGSFYSVVDLSD